METIIVRTTNGKNYNAYNEQVIPCTICGEGTTMLGTQHCDRCHELDVRIRMDPEIAERLVNVYRGE